MWLAREFWSKHYMKHVVRATVFPFTTVGWRAIARHALLPVSWWMWINHCWIKTKTTSFPNITTNYWSWAWLPWWNTIIKHFNQHHGYSPSSSTSNEKTWFITMSQPFRSMVNNHCQALLFLQTMVNQQYEQHLAPTTHINYYKRPFHSKETAGSTSTKAPLLEIKRWGLLLMG